MSRTEQTVRELVDDDPSMADAVAVVRRLAEENGGVEWSDVNDDITSGQWGRLIEKGVIVSNDDDQFELADSEAVDAALDEDGTVTSIEFDDDQEEIETSGWSQWDKLAGVGTLAIMFGYYFNPVQNAVGGAINMFLGPIDTALPFYAVILVLAMTTGAYSTVLQANLMNSDLMAKQQERVQAVRDKKKEAKERGDDEALERIREEEMEVMSEQMGMMKETFRPMVWIMLLTIPIFLWMYWMIRTGRIAATETTVVLPMLGVVEWSDGVVGPMQAWIVWYFLCSMGFTQLIRKSLNIQTSPTSA